MSDTNHQTDNRELTEPAIKQRLLNTKTGDRVLFNDRVQLLTVTKCPGEQKEWEIDFSPEGSRHIKTRTEVARTKDELAYREGDVVDWKAGPWEPPYEVTDIEECGCSSCNDLDVYELVLEGPLGGEYLIKNTKKGIRWYNTSADRSLGIGTPVYWFKNKGRVS
jgi:hypothetical protein